MVLTLSSTEDILAYVKYLTTVDQVSAKLSPIHLIGDDVTTYVNYLHNGDLPPTVDDANYEVVDQQEAAGKRRWTMEDRIKLSTLLGHSLSLHTIALELNRSESSVRKFTRNNFNLVYHKNKWLDVHYQGVNNE